MYKLSFFVPESHLEQVKAAVFEAGAGRIGDYDQCCWQAPGLGQFRPLEGSQPYLGQQGQVEQAREYKVEMVCAKDRVSASVQALLSAHPYEEPAYDIVALVDPASLD
ncbi:NGG1p interacting factor NIF3 [Gilvimarinus sp. F26214L]|uniref:NGG1p interacting factor NIF3 n=1 Tax=Gilvimarinus sp. DZF01 TaxID=3461371 RepID=UPI0040464FF8